MRESRAEVRAKFPPISSTHVTNRQNAQKTAAFEARLPMVAELRRQPHECKCPLRKEDNLNRIPDRKSRSIHARLGEKESIDYSAVQRRKAVSCIAVTRTVSASRFKRSSSTQKRTSENVGRSFHFNHCEELNPDATDGARIAFA
jgi:hypothetical protein